MNGVYFTRYERWFDGNVYRNSTGDLRLSKSAAGIRVVLIGARTGSMHIASFHSNADAR